MPERYIPTPEDIKKAEDMMTPEQKSKSELRERMLEAVKTDKGSYNNIMGAREVGIPEQIIKEYALRFMAADLRRENGYEETLKMVYRIAHNSKVVTDDEVGEMAKQVYTELINQDPSNPDAARFFDIAPVVDLSKIKSEKAKEAEMVKNRRWSIHSEEDEGEVDFLYVELARDATMEDLVEAMNSDEGVTEDFSIEDAINEDIGRLGQGEDVTSAFYKLLSQKGAASDITVIDFFKQFGNTTKDIETWLPVRFKKTSRKKK